LKARNTYLIALVLFAWWGAMAWNTYSFQRSSRLHENLLDGQVASIFPGNGWVNWKNSPDGVVVDKVHPLIRTNSLLEGQYLEKGDLLRRIDYLDIYDASVAEQIVSHAPPGKVLLFQVDRLDPLAGGQQWQNLFIETSIDPQFEFVENHGLWSLYPWILVLGSFLSLISLLIIYPIIRSRWKATWAMFGVIALSFVVFLTLLARHLNLLVSTEYASIATEETFRLAFSTMVLLHGILAVYSRLKINWSKFAVLPMLALAGWFVWNLQQAMHGYRSPELVQQAEPFLLHFILTNVLAILGLSIIEKWQGRSTMDKVFHLLSLCVVTPLFVVYTLGPTQNFEFWAPGGVVPEWPMLFVISALLIPMVSATASQLKFGKVSVVLTSSIQYLVFVGLSFLVYFLLQSALESLELQFKYQAYLELSAVLLVMLTLRFIYKSNEGRLRKYFVLAQQERRNRIDRFTARISQYTSSQQLLDDLVVATQDYFNADRVTVWMYSQPGSGGSPGMEDEELTKIYAQLQLSGKYWARNRQIAESEVPSGAEKPLSASDFDFAHPLTVNDDIYGLLLIHRKNRGIYNLEDLEIISRIVQQTQLTLGVLHLLEREKLLMQKNYEANLTALRSQINPHFLFNTLNTISALIHDAPDDAEVAVEKLAHIFRYTLKHSGNEFVPLREEMSLVQTYLEIEQIRFGARLELRFGLAKEMLEVELPAFVIQTIVENSIKHGIAKVMHKGEVSITARKIEGFMECVIEDNGPGIDHSKITSSTGLNNITSRLEQIYETRNLLYFENTGHGTRVTIKIPLEQ